MHYVFEKNIVTNHSLTLVTTSSTRNWKFLFLVLPLLIVQGISFPVEIVVLESSHTPQSSILCCEM